MSVFQGNKQRRPPILAVLTRRLGKKDCYHYSFLVARMCGGLDVLPINSYA